jgi:hypothetical protein
VVHTGKSNSVSHRGDYGGVEEWLQVFLNSAKDKARFTLQLLFETCPSLITQCVNVSLTRVVLYVSASESFGRLQSSPRHCRCLFADGFTVTRGFLQFIAHVCLNVSWTVTGI